VFSGTADPGKSRLVSTPSEQALLCPRGKRGAGSRVRRIEGTKEEIYEKRISNHEGVER